MVASLVKRLRVVGMNSFNFLIHNINKRIALTLPYKGRVVDLGCGTSQYKDDILKVADEYIGVDWQNSLHDQSNVDVFADLSEKLPFAEEYADTVMTRYGVILGYAWSRSVYRYACPWCQGD